MHSIKKIFLAISNKIQGNMKISIENDEDKIWEVNNKIDLLQQYIFKIDSEMNIESICMMKEVITDLYSALCLAQGGFYRVSYLNTRSALELSLGFLYFVDRRYYYLQWKKNEYDIRWMELTNVKEGVVCDKYIKMFNPEMSNHRIKEVISQTINAYRQCSEYVHGKYNYMQTNLNKQITYNQEEFIRLYEVLVDVIDIIIIFLKIRFDEENDRKGDNNE